MDEKLKNKIEKLPLSPGIYLMKDKEGEIIYIGKSKDLKKRVKSYFQKKHKSDKIKQMVHNIRDIDIIKKDSDFQAQVLECVLIKKHRPIYNSQYKSSNKYLYLNIESSYPSKVLTSSRDKKDLSLGPYRSRGIILNLISMLENLYPLGPNMEITYKPIRLNLTKEEFFSTRDFLLKTLTSQDLLEDFIDLLKEKMLEASSQYQFETASYYRDLINNLNYYIEIQKRQDLLRDLILEEDLGYKKVLYYFSRAVPYYKEDFPLEVNYCKFLERALKAEARYPLEENEALDILTIIYRELRLNNKIKIIKKSPF